MQATATEKTGKSIIEYGSGEYKKWKTDLGQFADDDTYLSVFTGPYHPDKVEAAREVAQTTGREFHPFDAAQIVHNSEADTLQTIEDIFKKYQGEQSLFYFANGENLFGIYTGYTFSRVKYATPEERHLMRLIESYNSWTIIGVESEEEADLMLKRKAHQIVNFPLPSSPLKRMRFKLGRYTFHGYETPSKRTSPELG